MSDLPERAAAQNALMPVRAALLARAHEDAERAVRAAEADADETMARARDEARAAVERARAEGEADAEAALAVDRGRARRRARALVLAAQRSAYDELLDAARAGVRTLLEAERWPLMRDVLADRARDALGPDATVELLPDGVVGRSGSRVLELGIDALADAQVEALGPEVERLWSL